MRNTVIFFGSFWTDTWIKGDEVIVKRRFAVFFSAFAPSTAFPIRAPSASLNETDI